MKKTIIFCTLAMLVLSLVGSSIGCQPQVIPEPTSTPPDLEEEPVVPKAPTSTPKPTSSPAPKPVPETGCPISCSADEEGWNLVFECEEEGQTVDQHFIEQSTTYDYGQLLRYHVVIDYEFETSGNAYHAIVDVMECKNSPTGYCITVRITGDTLGNETVLCTNY